jgi:hypothetical protein
MDARLTAEQCDLRDAAAALAADHGPHSVHDLGDDDRRARLEKAVASSGWRSLRSDGSSGVEVAIVAEEFGRGLVDVPFLGPVLADDLRRAAGDEMWTIAVGGEAVEARGAQHAVALTGDQVMVGRVGAEVACADLTRRSAAVPGPLESAGTVSDDRAGRFPALALAATCADLLGAARGAHALACDYAKIRTQYGKTIGSYQAVAHPLAEGRALIEGCISVLRYAAWAVDELRPEEAIRAGQIAKLYCTRAARTICETAVQVHGGIGNTWECLAHVYLRRVLTSAELFGVSLEEFDCGLP